MIEASLPGINTAPFPRAAVEAKQNWPVSKVLEAVEITLSAKFI